MIDYQYKKFVKNFVAEKIKEVDKTYVSSKELVDRILYHQSLIPDYLQLGVKLVAISFLIKESFIDFIKITKKQKSFSLPRHSKLKNFRNLMRFHDGLFEMANVENGKKFKSEIIHNPITGGHYDFVIVGSGPGGSVAASKLIKEGFKTLLIEGGKRLGNSNIEQFSYSEMLNKYSHGGVTTTLGKSNISFVEGATFGGGSEVNSGLYHRTPAEILDHWSKNFSLKECLQPDLDPFFNQVEKDLSISYYPNKTQIPLASLKLEEGAKNLGWDVQEVPRWFKYQKDSSKGDKMTMTKVYLNQYIKSGGEVKQETKIHSIKKDRYWHLYNDKKELISDVTASNIILSAGAINTPLILKNSNISYLAGKRFQMHPTIKVVALFDEEVNNTNMGVPIHQVKEYSPRFSLGCSISSKPYLRLAMLDHIEKMHIVENHWKQMGIYYAMILPESYGTIKKLPFFKYPLLNYNLGNYDKKSLSDGLKSLCKLLLSSGAKALFPSINNGPVITSLKDLRKIPNQIDSQLTSLMTIHLFSSCPIGENQNLCVANSHGKVFGKEGLFISDGSMIPSAPGVNPQGTIMALAHKNIKKIASLQ